MGGGSFFTRSEQSDLKQANPTMIGLIGLMMGAMGTQAKICFDKEDVTQSLRYYDQNNFGHNIIDVE
jgi:hypothetical protein